MMNQPTLLMSLKMMESAVTASSLTPTRKMQTMMGRVENTMHNTCTHLRPYRSGIKIQTRTGQVMVKVLLDNGESLKTKLLPIRNVPTKAAGASVRATRLKLSQMSPCRFSALRDPAT